MGLDSIELLMAYEDFFEVQIPDLEAEKIVTIADMVEEVAHHKSIGEATSELLANTRGLVNQALLEIGVVNEALGPNGLVFTRNGLGDIRNWEKFKALMKMPLPCPKPIAEQPSGFLNRLAQGGGRSVNYDWRKLNLDQLVTGICAANFRMELGCEQIRNRFDILISIAAITVERIGVDYYEVQPNKSFSNDLGID